MQDLLKTASDRCLRVLMIGGKDNLALRLVQCYLDRWPQTKFKGLQGIADIKNIKKEEEHKIFSIVAAYKPQLVFAAFGSPDQELWLNRHNKEFAQCVVMGVGGAFDYLSNNIKRSANFYPESWIGMVIPFNKSTMEVETSTATFKVYDINH